MSKTLRHWLASLAILVLAVAPLAPASHAQSAPAATSQAQPHTNAEIRQWYNNEVGRVPALSKNWIALGYTAEHRAELAQEIRHNARIKAREFMGDKRQVVELQQRDQEKYGDPDGPTFGYLVAENRKRGLTGDAVYEAIVGSASRTDEGYNVMNGVKPVPKAR